MVRKKASKKPAASKTRSTTKPATKRKKKAAKRVAAKAKAKAKPRAKVSKPAKVVAKPAGKRGHYQRRTPEEREAILREAEAVGGTGGPLTALLARHNVPASTFYVWRSRAQQAGGATPLRAVA